MLTTAAADLRVPDFTPAPPTHDDAAADTTARSGPRHRVRLPRTGPAYIDRVIPGTYGKESRLSFRWNMVSVARLALSPTEAYDRWRATFDIPVFQVDHAPGSLILIRGRRRPLFAALTLDPDDSQRLVFRSPAATPESWVPGAMGQDLLDMWDEVIEALRLEPHQLIRLEPRVSPDATIRG